MVDRLTLLQLDPTAAVAPSADLVAWTRLGNAYQPEDLRHALEADRTLFEHRAHESETEPLVALVRPMSHLRFYLADMADWPRNATVREWLEANDAFRRRMLDQLRAEGPL